MNELHNIIIGVTMAIVASIWVLLIIGKVPSGGLFGFASALILGAGLLLAFKVKSSKAGR